MQRIELGFVIILGGLLASCGGPPSAAPSTLPARPADVASARTLDWSILLPLETEGILRLDLARLRRSPYQAALDPHLRQAIAAVGDAPMQATLTELLERTDVVLLAMLPADEREPDAIVALARGDYRPDEIERLEASATESTSHAVTVRGERVWVERGAEATSVAVAQLRPDTLALTSSLERMDRLIARMAMQDPGPRWPPSVRALVAEGELEAATVAVALGARRFGAESGMPMAFAGRADLDGPLDVEVRVTVPDPSMASAVAMMFQAMLQGMANGAEATPALAQLDRLAEIRAQDDQVVGTLRADLETARQLVPALLDAILAPGAEGDREVAPPAPPPIL